MTKSDKLLLEALRAREAGDESAPDCRRDALERLRTAGLIEGTLDSPRITYRAEIKMGWV